MAYVFAPKWLLSFYFFFLSECKDRTKSSQTDEKKKTKVILKIAGDPPLTVGVQINTAFGYFKKMIEDAHRQPRAASKLWCMCVFRELFLRGRQRAAKLKQSHTVIIFSPVCCGLVLIALSLLASSKKERLPEKRQKGAGPEENKQIHAKKKSDVTGTVIFPHLCKVTKSPWPERTLALAAKVVRLHSKC